MRIRQERERSDDERSVRLRVLISAGRPVAFAFQGANLPKKVTEQVAEAWRKGVVDVQRLQEGSAVVRPI